MITFVCSVGNIPLAAILWTGGASFAGVLSFIYADLIVLPLLDTYRRYFGWRFAAYIFGVLFVTMVAAGIIVDVGFGLAHLTPAPNPNVKTEITHFSLDYTFWLNLFLGFWAVYLFVVARRHPMQHGTSCCASKQGAPAEHGAGRGGQGELQVLEASRPAPTVSTLSLPMKMSIDVTSL